MMSHDEGKEKEEDRLITIPVENKQEKLLHWWKKNGCPALLNKTDCVCYSLADQDLETQNMVAGSVNSPSDKT